MDNQKSKKDNYCTPPYLIKKIERVLDGIDIDPCSNEHDFVNAKIRVTDIDYESGTFRKGLSVFMNPPYSRGMIQKFFDWLMEYRSGYDENRGAIVLVNSSTDTWWYQNLVLKCDCMCMLLGRINFYLDGKKTSNNRYGQTLFLLNSYNKDCTLRFFEEFGGIGVILERFREGD